MTQQIQPVTADASCHISTDSEDHNIVCDISIQADKPRLCPAKQAHELVLGKTDASLAKKLLTISDSPPLDTKALIRKLDEVAKTIDLDVSTILEEQMKDPVLVLYVLGFIKTLPPILNHQKYNNLKVSCDNAKKLIDFLLKTKDSSFVTVSPLKN